MKRKNKNIFMFLLLIILFLSSFLTVYYAKESTSDFSFVNNSSNSNNGMMIQNNGAMMPEMPNSETNNNSNMEEPPEKPDGSNPNGMMRQQDKNGIPNMKGENKSSSVSIIYYLLFGVQSLGISLLLIYLIMSGFNKKTLKETFISSDKITIYILSIIILTIGLTFTESYIVKNNSKISSENEMMQNNIGGNDANISYSGSYEITKDLEITSGEYNSSNKDENTILVSEDIDVTLKNIQVEKTGDSVSGDNTSFYGINSAILAKNGGKLNT